MQYISIINNSRPVKGGHLDLDTFLHYSEHVVVRGFSQTSCVVFPSPVAYLYEPPPLLPSTTYPDSEARGVLRQYLHILSGLSRFCGVWSPRNHDVDI